MTVVSRSRGRPRGDDGEARRALLRAGRCQFAQHGYAGTSTREIVAAAGVTAPALYHHFGSKAGLYAAVTEEVNDIVLEAFAVAIAGSTSQRDRVDAILDASIEIQASDPALSHFVIGAPIDFSRSPDLASLAPQMTRLRTFLERTFPGGSGEGDLVALLLTLIFGLSRLAASSRPADYRSAVESVRSFAHRALSGPRDEATPSPRRRGWQPPD
jgi:AcrR family transcriptional regulator